MVIGMLAFSISVILFFLIPGALYFYFILLGILFGLILGLQRQYFSCGMLILGLIGGYLWSQASLHEPDYCRHLPGDLDVVGYINDLPIWVAHHLRFQFVTSSINKHACKHTYLLHWYGKKPFLRASDQWRLHIKIRAIPAVKNEGQLDYAQWLFAQGINGVGYVEPTQTHQLLYRPPWYHSINVIRQQLAYFIQHAVIERTLVGAIVASTIGSYHLLKPEQWQVLQNTGTTHLIAISGMNVSLVASLFYFLSSWCWRRSAGLLLRIPAPKIAVLSGLVAALLYSLLAGMTIPTERALIMLAVVLVGELFYCHIPPFYRLLVALFLILLLWPLAAISISFWLSYFAVFILSLCFGGRMQATRGFYEWCRIQLLIFIGLLPLTFVFFKKVSIISIWANLIAIPYMSFIIVPLCLFASVFFFISPAIDFWLWFLTAKCFYPLWFYLSWLARWPFAVWQHTLLHSSVTVSLFFGTLLVLTPRAFPGRALAWIFFLPIFFYKPTPLKPTELRITVFAIQAGLMTAIETQKHVLVYLSHVKSRERKTILKNWLKSKGLTQIQILTREDKKNVVDASFMLCKSQGEWLWEGVRFFTSVLYGRCILDIVSAQNRITIVEGLNLMRLQSVLKAPRVLIFAANESFDLPTIPTVISRTSLAFPRPGYYSTAEYGSLRVQVNKEHVTIMGFVKPTAINAQ